MLYLGERRVTEKLERVAGMKSTEYFLFTKNRPDRAAIKDEWICQTIDNPIQEAVQSDGRIRRWRYIEEIGKHLRVILLDDGETVHNAFFDRNFKEQQR